MFANLLGSLTGWEMRDPQTERETESPSSSSPLQSDEEGSVGYGNGGEEDMMGEREDDATVRFLTSTLRLQHLSDDDEEEGSDGSDSGQEFGHLPFLEYGIPKPNSSMTAREHTIVASQCS